MPTTHLMPVKLTNAHLLVVVAAPKEVEAVLGGVGSRTGGSTGAGRGGAGGQDPIIEDVWVARPIGGRLDLVQSGVGKANAAGAVARCLDPARHGGVLSLGICGALPGSGLGLGDVVLSTRMVNADEGLETPAGWVPCAGMGFPLSPSETEAGIEADPVLFEALRPLADAAGVIATVSTCAGTDARAAAIAGRSGGLVEAMEGAGAAQAADRLGVGACELRVVSNTTGDRDRQQWDLAGAFSRLRAVSASLGAMFSD